MITLFLALLFVMAAFALFPALVPLIICGWLADAVPDITTPALLVIGALLYIPVGYFYQYMKTKQEK